MNLPRLLRELPMPRARASVPARLLSAVVRSWYLVAACILAALVVGLAYRAVQSPSYEATASIYFAQSNVAAQALGNTSTGSQDPDRRAATNTDLLELPAVADRAARYLGGKFTQNQVLAAYTVDAAGQSDVVRVHAVADDPRSAAAIANAVVRAAVQERASVARQDAVEANNIVTERIQRLSKAEREGDVGAQLTARQVQLRLLISAPAGDAKVVEEARVPGSSTTPGFVKTGLLAAILGGVIGTGLALMRDRVDPRVLTEGDLLEVWDLPVLATLPHDDVLAAGRQLTAASASLAPLAIARESLRLVAFDDPPRVVGVVSGTAGEGKTTVAWGLAATAAAEGARVLLVEADLRMPSLVGSRGVAASPGLGAVLSGRGSVEEAIRPSGLDGLAFDVLPAGGAGVSPLTLLRGPHVAAAFAAFRESYDFVVVDLPPVTLVPDPLVLAEHIDGFLFVTRLGVAKPEAVRRSRQLLDELSVPIYGAILNDRAGRPDPGYGYSTAPAEGMA